MPTGVHRGGPWGGAVVPGDPPSVTGCGDTWATLEMLTNDSVLFADGLAVFEETPEMITEVAEGRAVAQALGEPASATRRRTPENDGKLFAAAAGEHVFGAPRFVGDGAQVAQDLLPGLVAMGVVHLFAMVAFHQDQRAGRRQEPV